MNHHLCTGPRSDCKWCAGRADHRTCNRQCGACPVRCCAGYGYLAALFERGLSPLDGPRLPGIELDLPEFVPQVDRPGVSWPAVVVGPDKMFLRYWKNLRLRWGGDYRHLNPGGLVGVHFYMRDVRLERLYHQGERLAFWYRLGQAQIDFVIGPNFSIWDDDPALEHAYNVKRSQILCLKMAMWGLPVIPDVVGPVQQWAGLLPETGWVALNLSYFTTRTWPRALHRIRELDAILAPGVGIIANGVASERRQAEITSLIPRPTTVISRGWAYWRGRRNGQG